MGEPVRAEFSEYPRTDLPSDYYDKYNLPGFFDGYGPIVLGAVGTAAIVYYVM